MGRRSPEWIEQVKLSRLLDRWLDVGCTFATAVDTVARSATAGAMRKKRASNPVRRMIWYSIVASLSALS
jgi:hypothetical protein